MFNFLLGPDDTGSSQELQSTFRTPQQTLDVKVLFGEEQHFSEIHIS